MKIKKISILIFGVLIIFLSSPYALGHGVGVGLGEESGGPAHQYITNESKFVWKLIPIEIKEHLKKDIYTTLDFACYNSYKEEDVIIGSGEEDLCGLTPWLEHYWNADEPMNGKYDYGLAPGLSSYDRAQQHWKDIVNYYLEGDKDRAYYYFGRVVHLLQDASVPAHMHNDRHWPDKDEYELFTGDVQGSFTDTSGKNNFYHWSGSDYQNQYYKYENLTDLTGSEWLDINKRLDDAGYPSELFKLFWYTAQKTQYFASDDKYGNTTFRKSGSADTFNFSGTYPNLWQGENVNFVMDKDDIESDASQCNSVGVCPNLANISEALMPHAMKATAGLYRLFSDVMDSLEWETFHNNNRRTGFTLLKGDLWRFN